MTERALALPRSDGHPAPASDQRRGGEHRRGRGPRPGPGGRGAGLTAAGGPRPRVLCVEDNAANLALVAAVLEAAAIDVTGTATAAQALAWLEGGRADLILMDVRLPDGDGLELTRRLRALPDTARVPIIALTTHAMAGDAVRALEAGCDAYITKPIDTIDFRRQVELLLRTGRRLGAPRPPPA